MSKKTKFTKTQGHHCWWLNIHGESVANFNHERDVDELVRSGNMMPKLYSMLVHLVKHDCISDCSLSSESKKLLAEARGE